mmetsp:Transcript_36456/g.95942  ORF Transcript_36456/g.95942 Transcript_36456/m.95942 type:complete len:85 (-) Transcript_36456:28-282(-)
MLQAEIRQLWPRKAASIKVLQGQAGAGRQADLLFHSLRIRIIARRLTRLFQEYISELEDFQPRMKQEFSRTGICRNGIHICYTI